ncbi:Hypothetical protein SMAX5B_021988 [Scophthalmus maximus]|uniref:Uncharacterized protein n=1 Tax=Scophthalmus maximus TaxID=52904 RepID=A0A2U9CIB5_SCOMX|nr:Hypothetical protein SMAX5B_021988 [Scophthalmus maximus]
MGVSGKTENSLTSSCLTALLSQAESCSVVRDRKWKVETFSVLIPHPALQTVGQNTMGKQRNLIRCQLYFFCVQREMQDRMLKTVEQRHTMDFFKDTLKTLIHQSDKKPVGRCHLKSCFQTYTEVRTYSRTFPSSPLVKGKRKMSERAQEYFRKSHSERVGALMTENKNTAVHSGIIVRTSDSRPPWLAPYVSEAGGGAVEACWSCQSSACHHLLPAPAQLATFDPTKFELKRG